MSVFRNKQRGDRWAYDFVLGGERFRGFCLNRDGSPAAGVRMKGAHEAASESVEVGLRHVGPCQLLRAV